MQQQVAGARIRQNPKAVLANRVRNFNSRPPASWMPTK